jgi:RNA polymerase sigma factor (sigma-70 family)
MNQPTVFVVDDDDLVRSSLAMLLAANGLAVRTYESGEAFLAAYDPDQPGCLVLDLRMPGMSGLEVQAELNRRNSHLPILFLSGYGDIPTTVGAIKAGAEDFLTKPPDLGVLIEKVHGLLAKSEQADGMEKERLALYERINQLTNREREIFKLAVSGLSSKDIARQLALSQRTVENHRLRINRKLRTANLLEFAHQASRCGVSLG